MSTTSRSNSSLASSHRRLWQTEDAAEECERTVRRVYEHVVGPGDIAFDVGAHVGKHTVPLLMSAAPGGKVVAVEPIGWALEVLQKRAASAQIDSELIAEQAAASSAEGSATFSVAAGRPGRSSLVLRPDLEVECSFSIGITTVDTLAEMHGAPRFIKIDAEGAEYDILLGAKQTIAHALPVVHFETSVSATEAFGRDVHKARLELLSHGYRIYDLLGNDVSSESEWAALSELDHDFDCIAAHQDDPALTTILTVLSNSFPQARRHPVLPGELNRSQDSGPADPAVIADDSAVRVPADAEGALNVPGGWYWPGPSKEIPRWSVAILPQGSSVLNLTDNVVSSLNRFNDAPLPLEGFVHDLQIGWGMWFEIELQRSGQRTETLFETYWPSSDLSAVVRTHRDRRLEVIWFRRGERLGIHRTALLAGKRYYIRLDRLSGGLRLAASCRAGGLAQASIRWDEELAGDADVMFGRRISGRSIDPTLGKVFRVRGALEPTQSMSFLAGTELKAKSAARRVEHAGGKLVRRLQRGGR